mgnify:CR=1 FL=1
MKQWDTTDHSVAARLFFIRGRLVFPVLEKAIEGRSRYAEQLGGTLFVAACLGQGALNFVLLQAAAFANGRRGQSRMVQARGQVAEFDRMARAIDQGVLDRVLKLPDVSRPRVRGHCF